MNISLVIGYNFLRITFFYPIFRVMFLVIWSGYPRWLKLIILSIYWYRRSITGENYMVWNLQIRWTFSICFRFLAAMFLKSNSSPNSDHRKKGDFGRLLWQLNSFICKYNFLNIIYFVLFQNRTQRQTILLLFLFDEITDLIHENQIPLVASMIYLMCNIANEVIVDGESTITSFAILHIR